MADYKTLIQHHRMLRWRYGGQPLAVKQEEIRELIGQIEEIRKDVSDQEHRKTLDEIERYWRAQLRPTRQRLPLWGLIVGGALLFIIAAVGISYILVQGINQQAAAPPPTATVADVTAAAPGAAATDAPGEATVAPAETAASAAASPTTTAVPATPTAEPTPMPAATPLADATGDVAPLAGGAIIAEPPAGVDIATCNVATDTNALTTLAPPANLTDIEVTTDTLTIWLSLQTPAPAERALTYHWLVALDADGDTATGRSPGNGYINPDLGQDVGAGVFLYANGNVEPYVYVWNPALGDWDGDTPDIVTATVNETQDAVAFTFPLADLRTNLEQITGTSLDLEALRGRTATIASSQTQAAIVDYCPDLP
jgi:hypothetical protein